MGIVVGALPLVAALVAVALLVARYRAPESTLSSRIVTLGLAGFLLAYAALLTLLQALVWSQAEFTRLLLPLPLESDVPLGVFEPIRAILENNGGYFAFYAFGRFWLPVALALLGAAVVHGIAGTVHRFRSERFSTEDVWLFSGVSLVVIAVYTHFFI